MEYICATFDNGTEIITIPHDVGGIYLQHMDNPLEVGKTEVNIYNLPNTKNAVITKLDVGKAIKGVWRPGLRYNIDSVLGSKKDELARAKIDLRILAQKLDEILLYIEPDIKSLQSYGHKLREFLILACTEIESFWIYYMSLSGNKATRLGTNDYVKLCNPLYLKEYEVIFTRHPFKQSFKPFDKWNASNPTTSLPWYDAYNQAKHNKNASFYKATLENCLNAMAANIILFCVKFGPYDIIAEHDNFANLINEHFEIKVSNPDLTSFYVPMLQKFTYSEQGNAFSRTWIGVPKGWNWSVEAFVI